MCYDLLSKLWKDQPTDVAPDLRQVKRSADRLRRTIRARNGREYVAAGLVCAVFAGYFFVFANPLIRIASVLAIAGAVFVVIQLHRRASWREPSPEQLGASCLEFHRAALVRQRDALKDAWAWYVLPFVPTAVLMQAGFAMERPDAIGPLVTTAVVVFGVMGLIAWLNRVAARRLQREIERLDDLAATSGEPGQRA